MGMSTYIKGIIPMVVNMAKGNKKKRRVRIEKGFVVNRPTLPRNLPKHIPTGFEVEITEGAVRVIVPKPRKVALR